MTHSVRLFICSILAFGFTSCAIYKSVDIEVLEPGTIVFPVWMKNITLVDNSLPLDSAKDHNTYIDKYRPFTTGVKPDRTLIDATSVKVDSLSVGILRNSANRLLESKFFENVTVWNVNYRDSVDGGTGISMANNLIYDIADVTNADVVVSLDYVSAKDAAIIREVYPGWYDYPTLEVSTRSLWRIYNMKENRSMGMIVHQDTIYWEGHMIDNYKVKGLPLRADALIEGTWQHGANFADKLVPHWKSTKRVYFTSGGKNFSKVSQLIDSAAYDRVIAVMQEGFELTQSKRKRAMYAYNMALGSELKGDIYQASQYIKIALENLALMPDDGYENYYEVKIKQYNKILTKRLSQQDALKRQLTGEN